MLMTMFCVVFFKQAELETARKVILQLQADQEALQKVTSQLQADKQAAQKITEQLKESVDTLGAEIETRDRQSLARQNLAQQNEAIVKAMDDEKDMKISHLEGQVKEAQAALVDVRTKAEAMCKRADTDLEVRRWCVFIDFKEYVWILESVRME